MTSGELRVAIGGFGVIGKAVAVALDKGIAGLRLVAVSARDRAAARGAVGSLRRQHVPAGARGRRG